MTKSFMQVIIIMTFGLLIGVRFFAGGTFFQIVIAIAGILIFVGIFSLGFLFLSSTISLLMESPEGLQAVIRLLSPPPLLCLERALSRETFPPFLQAATALNPLTCLVTGIRFFAIGPDFYALGQTTCTRRWTSSLGSPSSSSSHQSCLPLPCVRSTVRW